MKKNFKLLSFLLAVIMIFGILAGFAQSDNESEMPWQEKIHADLWEVMGSVAYDKLIPIWLWLVDIDQKIITNTIIEETGFDPAVFENSQRFNAEIVPRIAQQIEERIGYEEAHRTVAPEDMNEVEKNIFVEAFYAAEIEDFFERDEETFYDRSTSLVNRAITAKVDEYIVAMRGTVERLYTTFNNNFIAQYVNPERRIRYNSRFTSTLILYATRSEIEAFAKNRLVNDISLFVNLPASSGMDRVTEQVGAHHTKGSLFNNGAGLRGTGVRIGILEFGEVFNPNLAQFSGIYGSRLFRPAIPGIPTQPMDDHANFVTSQIVGQAVTLGGRTHEGIVPLATAFQVGLADSYPGANNTIDNALNTINILVAAPHSVNVINMSGGWFATGLDYNYWVDRQFDRVVANTGVTFVQISGNLRPPYNINHYVWSPGKALNVITVGNAHTMANNGNTMLASPFNIYTSSCWRQADYLPNKPDLVAPGTNIIFPGAYGGGTATGTSMAAPIVTGVVAQMMEANPELKTNPRAVKARLVLAADPNRISATNNPFAADSTDSLNQQTLRERSGAGFLDAPRSVIAAQHARSVDFLNINSWAQRNSQHFFFYQGQRLRAVMVYDKQNTNWITSQASMDIIDFHLMRENQATPVVSVTSNRNNVRIIDIPIPATGYYYFSIDPRQIVNLSAGPNVHISFQTNDLLVDVTNLTFDETNSTFNYTHLTLLDSMLTRRGTSVFVVIRLHGTSTITTPAQSVSINQAGGATWAVPLNVRSFTGNEHLEITIHSGNPATPQNLITRHWIRPAMFEF
ncbi:MAG: S8/S53 family peptidase [Oscillospiraceae bacterium]|nr:S8/S53 family peptidase [Oscillospiraceae bacterium]